MTNDSTRKGTHGRTAVVALVAIALIGAAYGVHVWRQSHYIARRAASGIPTAQSMAEALRRQESVRGSIEVFYTYLLPPHPGRAARIHYIRAGGRSFIQHAGPHSTLSASFDISTGEGRELIVTKSGTYGVVLNHAGSLLRMATVPDPIRKPFSTERSVDLVDVVETGRVIGPMKRVDGHPCWPVEVESVEDHGETCVLWMDPKIGYCPRLIEFGHTKRPAQFWHCSGYRRLAPGIWFPMRISGGNVTDGETFVCDVNEVHISRAFPKSRIWIRFPSGTQVEDQVANRKYIAP